jgi:hypothetical protein
MELAEIIVPEVAKWANACHAVALRTC